MPKFSIIVAVYNIADYLPACVDSILRQSFNDYELLLIDDGATDNSGAICDEYANKHGDRVRALHKPNGGLSSARNYGLDAATGDYIFFIDGDDELCDDEALLKIAKRIDEYNEDIVIFGVQKYFIKDNRYENSRCSDFDMSQFNGDKWSTIKYLTDSLKIPGAAWVYVTKRSLIERIKLRFIEGHTAEDMHWYHNIMYYAQSMGCVNDIIYTYNSQRSGSITSQARFSGVLGVVAATDFLLEKQLDGKAVGLIDMMCRSIVVGVRSIESLKGEERDKAYSLIQDRVEIFNQSSKLVYHIIYQFAKYCGVRTLSKLIRLLRP